MQWCTHYRGFRTEILTYPGRGTRVEVGHPDRRPTLVVVGIDRIVGQSNQYTHSMNFGYESSKHKVPDRPPVSELD